MNKALAISDENVESKIYLIRGKKVMVDTDLAEMYGIETRILNQAVKRNEKRFPSDFMFQLRSDEGENLKSQIVISKWGGRRTLPFVFTEQGVAMLSSVLNSETAIEVNIQIIRIFTRIREVLINHKDFTIKLERLENLFLEQEQRVNRNDEEIHRIFIALRGLENRPEEERNKIGYFKDPIDRYDNESSGTTE